MIGLSALLAGGGAWAADTLPGASGESPGARSGAACLPDADMRGLLAAVDDAASRLSGLDAEAVRDAAAEVRTRIAARVEICARLDAAAAEVGALREAVTLRDRLIEIERGNVATYRAEWEALLAKPAKGGRSALGWTIGAGACVGSGGDVTVCGAGVFGWRF